MKRYIKDGIIKYANRIVVIIDGMQVLNPTEEMILADGWEVYEPVIPEPEPQEPQLEPSSYAMERAVVTMMMPQAKTMFASLDDQEALKVKELADTWVSKMGQQVNVGDRLWYDNKLYKVRMQHTVQKDWYPSASTSSMYEEIVEEHEGTKEDPIPYNVELNPEFAGMTLEMGKFYIQKGIIYECIEGTGIPVYDDLDSGKLDRYVKVAE